MKFQAQSRFSQACKKYTLRCRFLEGQLLGNAMPVSGIVITFDVPVDQCGETVESLRQIPEFTVGDAGGDRLAAVIDSCSKSRDREIHSAIEQLPHVRDIFLAMVAFEDPQQSEDRHQSEERL